MKTYFKHLNDQEWAEQAQRLAGLNNNLERLKTQKKKDNAARNLEIKQIEREIKEVTQIVMTRDMEVEDDRQQTLFAKGG